MPFERPSKSKLRMIWSTELHGGAVQCVHQFQVAADASQRGVFETYILASCGKRLFVYHLEAKSSSLAKTRLSLVCCEEMRWPITSVSTKGMRICVGCMKDSVTIYDFSPQSRQLVYLASATLSQLPVDCALVTADLAMVADRLGNIYSHRLVQALSCVPMIQEHMEDVFAYHYGEPIRRLHGASAHHRIQEFRSLWDVGWSSTSVSTEFANTRASNSPMVTAILGCGFTGSIVSLLNLRAEVFEVLKLLEQVLAEHPLTRPLLGNTHEHHRLMVSCPQGTPSAVDGDLITEYLRLRPDEQMTIATRMTPEFREKVRQFLPEDPAAILVSPGEADPGEDLANGAIWSREAKEEVAVLRRIIETLALCT